MISFDTEAEGIIHDAKFDFYGQRFGTSDSTGTVKIFKIENN